MPLPEAFKKNAEKKKEEGEVREGESDKEEKKPPFMKKGKKKGKKENKDTEIIEGGDGAEGVTKMNDPRKKGMPSLDDENNDACNKKMDKKGKDCGCSHKNDSLTPQEYIAACELGIQDRNRVYIRARLDVADQVRNDLTTGGTGKKCGNSYIPKQSNCTVNGGGQKASKPKQKTTFGNQLRAGLSAASAGINTFNAINSARKGDLLKASIQGNSAIAGARMTRSYTQNNQKKAAGQWLGHTALGAGLAVGGTVGNVWAKSPQAQNMARNAGASLGRTVRAPYGAARGAAQSASNAAFSVEQRMRGFKKMKRPTGKYGALAKRDSPWANGFSVTDAESALTANAMNLATDKYSNEKRKRNAQGQPRNIIYANTFNT